MSNEYAIRRHFINFVIEQAEERNFPIWYVGYYSETSESTFRRYMKGIGLPSPIKLIMIAELFECSVNELLGYENIEVCSKDRYFDSGRDTKRVVEYYAEQIKNRMEHADIDEETYLMLKRRIADPKLTDTYIFLQICDALDCTPSELLGY